MLRGLECVFILGLVVGAVYGADVQCPEPGDTYKSDEHGDCIECECGRYDTSTMGTLAADSHAPNVSESGFLYIDRCACAVRLCVGTNYGVVSTTQPASNAAGCAARARCAPGLDGMQEYRDSHGACVPCSELSRARAREPGVYGMVYGVDRWGTCECVAGATWDSNVAGCRLCAAGKYKAAVGSAACDSCTTHTQGSRIGSIDESTCGVCSNRTFQIKVITMAKRSKDLGVTRCLECPDSFHELKMLVQQHFIKESASSDVVGDIRDEAHFLRMFYWNTRACRADSTAIAVGWTMRQPGGNLLSWNPVFAKTRTVCLPGYSEQRDTATTLRRSDSTCTPCAAGTFKSDNDQLGYASGQEWKMRCQPIANCSMRNLVDVNPRIHTQLVYTTNREDGESYGGTTQRVKQPECMSEPYQSWHYPVAASPDAPRYAFTDHIEQSIMETGPAVLCASSAQLLLGATDWLLQLWEQGGVTLPLEPAEGPPACAVVCNAGYEFVGDGATAGCSACTPGKFKPARDDSHSCVRPECMCRACAAGTYTTWVNADACATCPAGFYCTGASPPGVCWKLGGGSVSAECRPATHYLTPCLVGTTAINCLPCPPAAESLLASVWVQEGIGHCRQACNEATGLFWDLDAGACAPCPGFIANRVGWTGARECEPLCGPQYFLRVMVDGTSSAPGEYACVPCSTELAVVCMGQAVDSAEGGALFAAAACSGNADTQCLSCAGACGVYKAPDAAAAARSSASALPGVARCGCACSSARGGYVFLSIEDSAGLWTGGGASELLAYLQLHNDSLLGNDVESICVRWQLAAETGRCPSDSVLKLEASFGDAGMVPAAWPTYVCKLWASECGAALRGSGLFAKPHVGVSELTDADNAYECHCQSGFYGQYDAGNRLTGCTACPGLGATSYAGTISVQGCYCSPGFARMRRWATADVPNVCEPCAEHNRSRTDYYCPGGLVLPEAGLRTITSGWFLGTSMAPVGAAWNTSNEHGTVRCSEGRGVRQRTYAAFPSDCVPDAGWTVDTLGVLRRCDNDIAGGMHSLVTLWDQDHRAEPCAHTCGHGAHAVPSAVGDTCRCNAARGYGIANESFHLHWVSVGTVEPVHRFVFVLSALSGLLGSGGAVNSFSEAEWQGMSPVAISDDSYIAVSSGARNGEYFVPVIAVTDPARCVCAAGWHATVLGAEHGASGCALCAVGFYCEGGEAPPMRCPMDMLSPPGTKWKRGCRCAAGYYRLRSLEKGDIKWWCTQCPARTYCAVGCVYVSQDNDKKDTRLGQCFEGDADVSRFVNQDVGMIFPTYCLPGYVTVGVDNTCVRGAERYGDGGAGGVQTTSAGLLLNLLVQNTLPLDTDKHFPRVYFLYNPRWDEVLRDLHTTTDMSLQFTSVQGPGPVRIVLRVVDRELTDNVATMQTVFEYAVVHVGALQVFCHPPSVLVLRPDAERGLRLSNSFCCVDVATHNLQVVHRALALPAQKTMGTRGFVDHASIISGAALERGEEHAPWAVAVECSTARDNVTCEVCDGRLGEQLRIARVAAGSFPTRGGAVRSTVVFLDTASQHFWKTTTDTVRYGRSASDVRDMPGVLVFAVVEIDNTQATATRVSIVALTGATGATGVMRTLFVFEFPVLRDHIRAGLAEVKFAITTTRWRNSSAPPTIITGACLSGARDTLHLSVYSMYLNHSFHTEIFGCERCCDPTDQSRMHAHIDMVQGTLVLIHGGVLNTVSLRAEVFDHTSYKFRLTGVQVRVDHNIALGAFTVVHSHVRSRMVFPTDVQGQGHELYLFVLAHHHADAYTQGMWFGVVETSSSGATHHEYLQLRQIEAEVQQQLSRDHFSASHVLESGFRLHAESFVLLNKWDYNISQRLQPLPPTLYVVFSCTVWHTPGAEGVGMRLFVHVAIDTSPRASPAIAVTVLGASPMPADTYFAHFAVALAPLHHLDAHPSVLAARVLVVAVDVVAGGRLSVQSMALRCAGCSGSDGSMFDSDLQTCVCMRGAVSVCVPCTDTMQCSLHQFTFDAAHMQKQACIVKPLPSTRRNALYYEICVKCQKHSSMYCPDGAAPEQCPAAAPYTRVEGASSVGECACGHDRMLAPATVLRRSNTDAQLSFDGCPGGWLGCETPCVFCGNSTTRLCNALLPDNFKVVTCPPHTRTLTTTTMQSKYVTRVEQACVCVGGFRRTGTAAAYHTPASALDANIYSAVWSADNSRIFKNTNYSVTVAQCSACSPGHYCPARGDEHPCHANSSASADSTQCQCDSGWYGWTEHSGCLPCPKGHVCFEDRKHDCAARSEQGLMVRAYCPCPLAGRFFDEKSDSCEPCPLGHYCPAHDIEHEHTHDAYAINRAVRCPARSTTRSTGTPERGGCICEQDVNTGLAYFMALAGCAVCPAGSYCERNVATPCPDGLHTSSPSGSASSSACACTDPARVLSSAVCVCVQGLFYANGSTGECVACKYPYSSSAHNSRQCDICANGFWTVNAANQQVLVAYASENVDHPLSAQHRAAMLGYLSANSDVLQKTPRGALCLLCPPGLLCENGKLQASGAGHHYLIFPAGATGMQHARPCPRTLAYDRTAHRAARALAMVGGCFDNAATWHIKDALDASVRVPLLDMPFPVVVLFNSSQNTTILSDFMNNHRSPAISAQLYIDFEVSYEIRDIGSGMYALVASIDTTSLMRDILEEMHPHEAELIQALDEHDQGTGAAFAALLPVLWAVRTNRFLQPHAYGEAVAVVGGVVRNAVTEYIVVKAAGRIDSLFRARTATQLLFLAGHDNLDTMEVAHDLFADGALQYVHTGACDEATGTGVFCVRPYPAFLASAYTSLLVSNIHGPPSSAEAALLQREIWLREMLGMRAPMGVVSRYACPAHTITTATHTHAGFSQRYCSACAPHTYYDRERGVCAACRNTPTCSDDPSLVAHTCSWTRDFVCVDCAGDARACVDAVL